MTSRYFAAFCLRESEPDCVSRFGFTTPRALGKAVKRNRMKRRMRAAVSHHIDVIAGCWSIVFNPRRSVLDAPFDDLCQEVERLFARCKQS
jgi:ribonuclease P protein component